MTHLDRALEGLRVDAEALRVSLSASVTAMAGLLDRMGTAGSVSVADADAAGALVASAGRLLAKVTSRHAALKEVTWEMGILARSPENWPFYNAQQRYAAEVVEVVGCR